MPMDDFPIFCLPCIQRIQAHCSHLHTSFWGGLHFSHGEVWDDITEICDDCGVNMDELPKVTSISQVGEEIPI